MTTLETTKVVDRVVNLGETWVRVSAVEAIARSKSSEGATVYLKSGATFRVPARQDRTSGDVVKEAVGLVWPAPTESEGKK